MKRDLTTIIADIKNGKRPPLLLLFGDDLQVGEACKSVLDSLVPESQRGFNLERFNGRTVEWDLVEASLMTPPFFPGKKVVWVEDAPYFSSHEQKGELGERILQLWGDGQRDDARKLLLDLLVIEGWTQDQWERLEPMSLAPLMELLGADGREANEQVEALFGHVKSKGLILSQRRASEEHRLGELLDRGLPEWDFLLLTATQVDRRTRLYKRVEDLGVAQQLALERDRSGRVSRESMADFINQRLRQAGKSLEAPARELILRRAGDELRALSQELEKLLLYTQERASIRVEDVGVMVTDQGEGWIFDLTQALGDRDAVAALAHLARLMTQGEHPLKLLGTLASETRRLLSARQLIGNELRGLWKRGMTYQQFQQHILKQGAPLLTRSAYADYMCFQRADRFSLGELRAYMDGIHEADFRLKSSGTSGRLVMETLILRFCLGSPKEKVAKEALAGI
jgi:DNA polymerase-3 subunit delta